MGLGRVGGQKFALFYPLPPQFSFFLLSLGCLVVEIGWCLKRRGPEMCTFGVLGLSCEAPAPKPPQPSETPAKFNEKTLKRGPAEGGPGEDKRKKKDIQKKEMKEKRKERKGGGKDK